MSNLKYKSASELRDIISWCERKRQENQELWQLKEGLAEKLVNEARDLRVKYHNIGQKEAWARIYLAQKDE